MRQKESENYEKKTKNKKQNEFNEKKIGKK